MSYPRLFTTPGLGDLAEELDAERGRQLAKWGDQRHPDGTGTDATLGGMTMTYLANMLKDLNDRRSTHHYPLIPAGWSTAGADPADNGPHWLPILLEEVFEAGAETDPAKLRDELIQVAAVCAAWINDIDQRPKADTTKDAQ